jgi:Zn-dependent membrane protease YugP
VNYAPVKIRTAIVPITNFGAKLSAPLIVGGLVLCSVAPQLIMLAYLGVACFGLSTLFQLVTLPTEFNASRRAMQTIDEMGILQGEELQGAKKVLSAAALTYVAALAVSAMQLLRFIIMVSGRRRD